jgi:hypothetical protein
MQEIDQEDGDHVLRQIENNDSAEDQKRDIAQMSRSKQ